MAEDVKISEVAEGAPRRWEWQGKGNLDYRVKIDGHDEWLVLTQQEGGPHPKPEVGQSLFAEIDSSKTQDGKFPPKLKRAKQFNGGGGGFSKSPEQTRRIERMAAHKTAAQLLQVMDMKFKGSEDLLAAHKFLADKLEADLP